LLPELVEVVLDLAAEWRLLVALVLLAGHGVLLKLA
jgi:hypothetical protein